MNHRPRCEAPEPFQRISTLSDGQRVRVSTCPECGAVALTVEPRR